MIIDDKKVVSLTYQLREDNAEGKIVETVEVDEPLVFIFGAGHMLPDFESKLKGLKTGDSFNFGLTSKQAYGDYDKEYIMDLPIDVFNVDGEDNSALLKIGNMIPMRDEHGNSFTGKVLSVAKDSVKLDFNHPMAGKGLHFTGKIIEIREATKDELSHGHIHHEGCSGCGDH